MSQETYIEVQTPGDYTDRYPRAEFEVQPTGALVVISETIPVVALAVYAPGQWLRAYRREGTA